MQARKLIVAGALSACVGYVLYDYYGTSGTNARELREIEKLAPDAAVPSCFPQHPHAKVFASAAQAAARRPETLTSEPLRRSLLKHDCIRGSELRGNVERLGRVLGDGGIPLFAGVIDRCPVSRNDVSPAACFALDALSELGSPAAVAVLERLVQERKVAKEVVLGAVWRLAQTPGWKAPAAMAELLLAEKEWEAKELYLEVIRSKRDPAARSALEKAWAIEPYDTVKHHLQAALLELDNPGRCVVEDGGLGSDGYCRYYCRDRDVRVQDRKQGNTCPLVRDAPGGSQVAQESAPR